MKATMGAVESLTADETETALDGEEQKEAPMPKKKKG